MRSFLPRRHDLKGTTEVAYGIAILRVSYGRILMSRSHAFTLIRKLLTKLYKTAVKNLPGIVSCAVIVEAGAELDDLSLIRAVICLWNIVTREGGRLALIGYPGLTVSGKRPPLPPMLPNFGLAVDFDSGLKWVTQSGTEYEGGNTWHRHPGVSRGRSLIPGEKREGWDLEEN